MSAYKNIKSGFLNILAGKYNPIRDKCSICNRELSPNCLWTDCPYKDNSNKNNMLYIPATYPTWKSINNPVYTAGANNIGQNNSPGKNTK